MNTQPADQKPLWVRLNENRTQGKLEMDTIFTEGEINLLPIGKAEVVCSFYSLPLTDTVKADAMYAQLAINNFASIVEALEGMIKMFGEESNSNASERKSAEATAKQALNKIS